jgi:hypothetical protein
MSTPDLETALTPRLRTMQIICGAMMIGVVAFLVVSLLMRAQGQFQQPGPVPIITYIALGLTAMLLALQTVVPRAILTAARRGLARKTGLDADAKMDADVWELCGIYQTRLIVGCAMAEGPAFFCLIAYLIEGQWITVAAAVLGLLVMASKFPTRDRLLNWLAAQQELLQYERSLQ